MPFAGAHRRSAEAGALDSAVKQASACSSSHGGFTTLPRVGLFSRVGGAANPVGVGREVKEGWYADLAQGRQRPSAKQSYIDSGATWCKNCC